MAVDYLEWAKIAVGAAGTYQSIRSGRTAAKVANVQMAQGAEAAARQKAILEQYGSSMDSASYKQAVDILKYFLGGGQAKDLTNVPGIRDQFDQVDESLAAQLRQIAEAETAERMQISQALTGGAKLRALVDIARKTQDLKGQAIRQAQEQKKNLNISLTNQWFTKAMDFGKGQPTEYAKVASELNRGTGVSPDTQLQTAMSAMKGQQENLAAIQTLMGAAAQAQAERRRATGTGIETTYMRGTPTVPTTTQTYEVPKALTTKDIYDYDEDDMRNLP